MKRFSMVIPVLFCAASLHAQSSPDRAASHPRAVGADTLTTMSLKVDGLTYGREIDRIYWGDFEQVHLNRNGMEFGLIINSYMHDFGVVCASVLPRNKVQIMGQRCTEYSRLVNGYGVEQPFSRTCTHYETYGTGVFADPDLYNASQFEDGKMAAVMLGQLGSALTKSGDAGINAAMGNLVQNIDFARQAGEFKSDLQSLLHNNTCGGTPLKRLEKNLIAYATGRPPIRMAGIPTSSGPSRDSDYQTLLDDLVSEQSSGWMLNRFLNNSISNVTVNNRDNAGHPLSVSANYAYQGTRGREEGKVELRFEDGAPHCLVFADVPDACRAVNRRLAAAYEDGKYVTDHPAEARKYVAPDLRQVDIVADPNQQVLVEIPGKALDMPQGRVFPMRGKLLQDIRGVGPGGGSVVLAHAGSPVNFSVFNSQRGTEFHLARVGDDPTQAIDFYNSSKEFRAGVNALPHDGSPFKLSFDLPANIKKRMLLTVYEKQKTVVIANASALPVAEVPVPSRTAGSDGGASPHPFGGAIEPHKVLRAGTLLQLQFANAITVNQVVPGMLFPATVVSARTVSPIAGSGKTLPDGTTVFVRITQVSGSEYRIQADHAVVQGADIPLDTNAQPRMPMRSAPRTAPVQVRGVGGVRLPVPAQDAGSMVIVPAATVIHLSTKSNAIMDGAPQ
jgi:hypothetical protein